MKTGRDGRHTRRHRVAARSAQLRRFLLPLIVAGASTSAVAACGGSAPTPSPLPATAIPSLLPLATPLPIQDAVLQVSDFSSGARPGSTSVPDLTGIKCTPNQALGVQKQYKSDTVAASGREYGNVLAVFDTAADAQTFMTQFYNGAGSCSDAASAPTTDTFGSYSFYFTITGSPSNLNVEAVQVNQWVSVLIQYVPQGAQQNEQQSLRDLTLTSVNKLSRVGA